MGKQLKLLLLTEYFPPEIGAGSIRASEFATRWSERANVTVLTAFPNYPQGIIPKQYRWKIFSKELKDTYTIIRSFIIPAANTGILKRLISYLTFMASSFFQGLFIIGKQDIIIASSPPLFVGIAAYLISRVKRMPYILELRDLWPDILIEMGHLNNKFLIYLFKKIEFFLYKNSLHIVTVSPRVKEIIRNSGISGNKLSVITNGVNLDFFSRNHKVKYKINHISKGKFIVSYMGTLAYQYGLDNVLETAKLLKDREDILFLLVGEGPQKKEIKDKIEHSNLINVKLFDSVPLDQVRDYYTQVDIVLIPLRNLPLLESTIPVKLLESMAMEIPVIINANGVARDIMQAGKAGVYAEPDNPQKLMEKILYLYESGDIRKQMGKQGREHIKKHYDREKLANDYLALIDSLMNNKDISDST